ncbi:MAG: hypothetical protein AVDCRST_MAG59-3001, partial [uncultured Thermomicrobiales bacterium]
SATRCSGVAPGTWRTNWGGLRPTTPSMWPSRCCRRTRSSLWTRNWRAACKGSSRPHPSTSCGPC